MKSKLMLTDREKPLQVCERVAASLLLLLLCTSCASSAMDLDWEFQRWDSENEYIGGDVLIIRRVKKELKSLRERIRMT